jgi:hypothetical protein
MISRRTATAVGKAFQKKFTYAKDRTVYRDSLYEFLFNNDYPAWLCNLAKRIKYVEEVKEFFMKLHTGETQSAATQNWSWQQRERLGQGYLRELAEDFLNYYDGCSDLWAKKEYEQHAQELRQNLELDGYAYCDGRLLVPESDILDVKEVAGVLESLYSELRLGNKDVALHCLKLSEDHWLNTKWDDCISNARRFLECVLQEVASAHSLDRKETPLVIGAQNGPTPGTRIGK